MKKKSLLHTNPYLYDSAECKAALLRNVATSSAIEGICRSALDGRITVRENQRERSAAVSAAEVAGLAVGEGPAGIAMPSISCGQIA